MAAPRIEHLHTYSRVIDEVDMPISLAGMELVVGTETILQEVQAASPRMLTERKQKILRERIQGNEDVQVFFARTANGEWAGWCHLAWGHGPNSRIHHTLRLRPDEAFLFDDAVVRKHRRKGMHTFMILRRMQLASDRGSARAVTTITDSNAASTASFRKLGFSTRSHLLHVPRLRRSFELRLRGPAGRALRAVRHGR